MSRNGNYSRNKGASAEREVQGILRDLLGVASVRRALGAGRKDDVGDIHGLPATCIQVANYASLDRAVREKLPDLERQQENAKATFAAMFCRRRGGKYVVVMTPEQFACFWREAQPVETDSGRSIEAITQKGTRTDS